MERKKSNKLQIFLIIFIIFYYTYRIGWFWFSHTNDYAYRAGSPFQLIGLNNPEEYFQKHIGKKLEKTTEEYNFPEINISNWLTYRNENIGLEFKYPKDFLAEGRQLTHRDNIYLDMGTYEEIRIRGKSTQGDPCSIMFYESGKWGGNLIDKVNELNMPIRDFITYEILSATKFKTYHSKTNVGKIFAVEVLTSGKMYATFGEKNRRDVLVGEVGGVFNGGPLNNCSEYLGGILKSVRFY